MSKTAIIITGNPKYIEDNSMADSFYNEIEGFLTQNGYSVSRDPGNPYTAPKKADLWVGHSRGTERLKFASKKTRTVGIGYPGEINHPKDFPEVGKTPTKYHFMLTEEMKNAMVPPEKNRYLEKIAAEFEHKGYFGVSDNKEIEGRDMNEYLTGVAKDKNLRVILHGKHYNGEEILADSSKKDFDQAVQKFRQMHNAHRTMTGGKSNWNPSVSYSISGKTRNKLFKPEEGKTVDKVGRKITSKDRLRDYINSYSK